MGTAQQTAASGAFSAVAETDAGTGWKVLVLRYQNADNPFKHIEARIAPEAGGNLFSLKYGEDELLVQPEKLADVKNHRAGTPIMFPMVNRVKDATFTFEGKRFQFEPNNSGNFIHGLVRGRAWQFGEPTATAREASVDIWIDWNESQPDFTRFPLAHKITVTYTVNKDGLRIAYAVENRSDARLPYAFGLHPWFHVPGERKNVFVQVPAQKRMEAMDRLPSGKLIPVVGTSYDLRKPTSIETLNLDDAYVGLTPASVPVIEWRDIGVRMSLAASVEFTHIVVFTPPDKPVFCVENQTSSTDAHNLHGQGLKKESHLQVLAKGKTGRGTIDWKLKRIKSGS